MRVREWVGGRWPLVGREPELDAFRAALTDPECRGFFVAGAAGVGKSRLAEECVERAAADGFKVGRATATAVARAVPLGAIAHLLPAGVDLSDPVAGFAAVARELAAGPGRRRRVLLVDDVHLLDSASAVLLRQLMDTGAVRLIGTVRTGEPYGDAVAALAGGDTVYRVDLTELGPEQIAELLQAALGRPVARDTVHELSAASGGNVLYLRELVLGALTTGDLAEDGEIWHLREGRLPGGPRSADAGGVWGADAVGSGLAGGVRGVDALGSRSAGGVRGIEAPGFRSAGEARRGEARDSCSAGGVRGADALGSRSAGGAPGSRSAGEVRRGEEPGSRSAGEAQGAEAPGFRSVGGAQGAEAPGFRSVGGAQGAEVPGPRLAGEARRAYASGSGTAGDAWSVEGGGYRLAGTVRLAEVIGARLAGADSAGRPVLELLALCEPLPLADAEALAPSRVVAGLEQAGLIRVTQDRRRTTVSLAHPLYGEVLRAGLPVLRRRALLLDQAARTEARGARRRGDLLRIATWRLGATGTADPALLVQAAVLARHAHDYAQAVALLEAVPDDHHTIATRSMLGDAFFEMGRWTEAEAVLARADALARGEREKLAVALVRTTNLLWSNAPVAEALAVNDAALSHITHPADRRKLKINEGFMRIAAGQPAAGLALLEDLETDVRDASDVDAWLRGAWMKPAGLALVGRSREATIWAERAHAAHRQVDELALASHPAFQRIPLVLALTEAGCPAEARRVGERAFAELVAADSVVRVWMAVLLGRTEWLAGRPATARRWWAEAAALARTFDHAMALRPVLAGLAACAAVLGDLDAAETALAEHRTLPLLAPGLLSAGEERLGEAWLLAARGHLGRARSVLTAAARTARATGHRTGEALLLTDVARLGGAKEVTDRLTELARSCDGELAPARARLAEALTADDPGRLLGAADACEAVGADLLTAEAAVAASVAWHRAGEPRRASAAGRRAATAVARCEGARTPLLATARATAPLTVREREIALLAAVGNASNDIARALTLSVRTVDNHLHRAYAKLGVTTRGELAKSLGTPLPSRRPAPWDSPSS
ncbi:MULTISPECIES: AAA family ATPase [Streptomyces]|uniref:AAA family ATPase n=2 Tax=Streptomyces TaxID=1883 RepID=A0ABV9IZG5_9ACTN